MQTNQTVIKSGFYIVNDLYGGYSTKTENMSGFVDYANARDVIKLAKEAGENVHLASGRWQSLGLKGYGQLVSPEEALKYLEQYATLQTTGRL